jgi:hypothetical protein
MNIIKVMAIKWIVIIAITKLAKKAIENAVD